MTRVRRDFVKLWRMSVVLPHRLIAWRFDLPIRAAQLGPLSQ